uniref:Putative LOC100573895 [Acyrthosiphon pisum] n=1 Tax=Lepeophtheirus salmonis TaxID=72036 RepID=A0A0K2TFY2_LEPSM
MKNDLPRTNNSVKVWHNTFHTYAFASESSYKSKNC